MATRNDFTPEEWAALHRGVTGSGMLVSLSDRDFTDSFGEAGAMGKYISGQQMAGATELMRDIARQGGTGFGLTTNPQKLRTETMAAISTALDALKTKSPDDVQPYKDFVVGVAEAVANAKAVAQATSRPRCLSRSKPLSEPSEFATFVQSDRATRRGFGRRRCNPRDSGGDIFACTRV